MYNAARVALLKLSGFQEIAPQFWPIWGQRARHKENSQLICKGSTTMFTWLILYERNIRCKYVE